MGALQDFIAQMQQKFQPAQRLESGPTVEQVLPFAQRYGIDPELLATPQTNGNGNGDSARPTGRGPSGDVAGVVHNNEMVLEEDLVQNLGGPQNARGKIEELATMSKEPGIPKPRGEKQNGLPGFQEGTGDQTAEERAKRIKKGGEEAVAGIDLPDVTKRGPSRFEKVTEEGISGIRDIAAGKSKALDISSQASREQLAGRQSAESAAQAQVLAQRGVEGGTAAAAKARERRRTGIETGQLETEIRQEKAAATERATNRLAEIGFRGEQFEESRRQFEIQTEQRQTEFKENVRQFGEATALKQEELNFSNNQVLANIALKVGDFDAAGNAYAKMGVNVDMSKLETQQKQQDFANSMADLSTSIASGFDEDNQAVQNQLNQAAAAQNIDINTPEGQKWKSDTFKGIQLSQDPIHSVVSTMTDETMNTFLSTTVGLGDPDFNIDDFEFAGFKGVEAGRAAMTNLMITGGIDPVTGETDSDNPAWDIFRTNQEKTEEGTPEEPAVKTQSKFDDEFIQGAEVGEVTEDNRGNTIVRTGEGPNDFTKVDTEVNVTGEGRLGGKDVGIFDGTKWIRPTKGQIITLDSNVNAPELGGFILPKSTYKIVETKDGSFFEDVTSKERFPANKKALGKEESPKTTRPTPRRGTPTTGGTTPR